MPVETFLGRAQRQELHQLFRRNARPASEETVKVPATQTRLAGNFLKAWLILVMVQDKTDRAGHSLVVFRVEIYDLIIHGGTLTPERDFAHPKFAAHGRKNS